MIVRLFLFVNVLRAGLTCQTDTEVLLIPSKRNLVSNQQQESNRPLLQPEIATHIVPIHRPSEPTGEQEHPSGEIDRPHDAERAV